MFDFDSVVGRLPWHQSKWDPAALESQFGRSDVLPAWIADMDFKTVPAVQEAVIEAAKNGMYGYTRVGEDVIEAYLHGSAVGTTGRPSPTGSVILRALLPPSTC